MVSLSVADTQPFSFRSLLRESKFLHDNALWYPEIPGDHLHLNEASLITSSFDVTGFQPICSVVFGGLNDATVRNLVKISVSFRGYHIMVIEFHYDNGDVQKLGRTTVRYFAKDTLEFPINGAQGEAVKAVEVDRDSPHIKRAAFSCGWKFARLRSIKVRSFITGNFFWSLLAYTVG